MHKRVEFFKILDHTAQRAIPAISYRFFNGRPCFRLLLEYLLTNLLNFVHERTDRVQSFVGLLEVKVLRHGKKYTGNKSTGKQVFRWLYNSNQGKGVFHEPSSHAKSRSSDAHCVGIQRCIQSS